MSRSDEEIGQLIEQVRAEAGADYVQSRAEHEEKARDVLDGSAGHMNEDQAMELGRLFNTAKWGGATYHTRFAPAFQGATMLRVVSDIDLFNHWTGKLWSRDESEALDALDRIAKDPSTLPGAGRSYPSMLLYLRDSSRFAIWIKSTIQGLKEAVGFPGTPRSGGSVNYLKFSDGVREFRERFDLAPQEADAVLSRSYKTWKKPKQGAGRGKSKGGTTQPVLDLTSLSRASSIPVDELETWVDLLRGPKKQALFYGPPGTGKTFIVRQLGAFLADSTERVLVLQFHPSFSYEDFIEGLRPATSGDSVSYRIEPGVFLNFCQKAARDPHHTFVLVIDEINRADLGSVLGELMFLLEYRGSTAQLPYSKEQFSVPANVIVLATMNTADRSLALVDFALRRRFHAIELLPNKGVLETHFDGMDGADLVLKMFDLVQQRISSRDFAPGHSYWLVEDPTAEELLRVWTYELRPYLSEFWFEHPKQLEDLEKDVSGLLAEEL